MRKTKSKLINAMVDDQNVTFTENGAKTFKTTKSDVLDMFSLGGAYRGRSDKDVEELFGKAFAENKDLTAKCLFYLRDVRGGQGERRFFRVASNYWSLIDPKSLKKNLKNISEYGRWDDLVNLVDSELEKPVLALIEEQFNKDMEAEGPITLLGKWMPSENASSKETKRKAKKIRKALNLSSKEYRRALSYLRSKLDIIERYITSGQWDDIDFSRVPSNAMNKLKKAFFRHTPDEFKSYLDKVNSGESKINSSTLYPYEITSQARRSNNATENQTLDLQWKALPNYVGDSGQRAICVVDVSASMNSCGWNVNHGVKPIDVAISLGIYFAERNTGIFKDSFLTFSNNSSLQFLKGDTISEKVRNLSKASWGMSTNIQSSFRSILDTAVRNKIRQDEMPNTIIIISDMEFNMACSINSQTNYDSIKDKYSFYGYELPQIVFWNVKAKNDQSPVTFKEDGTALVSGFSPSILESVLSGKKLTPYDLMLDKLNSDRYKKVKV